MQKFLIAYSSVDGQTMKICKHIQQVLEESGSTVDLFEIGGLGACDMAAYDTVVVGASIRYGKHRPDIYRFIETHRESLERKRNAFFSVNVVARKAGKDTPQTNPYFRAFSKRTTWKPNLLGVFAGKIDYRMYGFFDRHMIRLIMWMTNGPTDMASSTEFTDWNAVRQFAHKLLPASLHIRNP
jgi:menaquinone-dependent protoporphyrinogen oxidase